MIAVNKKSILVAALLVLAIGMSAALVSAGDGTTTTDDSADGTATTTADGDAGAWGGHDGNCEDKDRTANGNAAEAGNSTATSTVNA